jgi:hypothetical protein
MKKVMSVLGIVLALAGWSFGKGDPPALRLFGGMTMARTSGLPDAGVSEWSAISMHDRFGVAAGVGFDLAIGPSGRLAWVGALEYVQKGAKVDFLYWDITHPPPGIMIPMSYAMDLVSLTQLLKLRPFANGSPYFLGGFELAYVIDHRSPYWPQLGAITRKVDFGLVAGVGGELLKGDWTPFLEARYHLGLIDLSKGSFVGMGGFPVLKTRAFVCLTGIRLKWGRRGA